VTLTTSTSEDGFFAGIDVGASTAKAVVVDAELNLLGHDVRPSGMDFTASGMGALGVALARAGRSEGDLVRLIATGYGRDNLPAAHGTRTEIDCHARGAFHHYPHAMTVVDVGGQDNKIIRISAEGKRLGFQMNRKCAAGTGAFLEEIATRLAVPLAELNELARAADGARPLNSFCTVFASTEVLSRIRAGEDRRDIARGIFASMVARVVEADTLDAPVLATGGVAAHNPAFVELLGQAVGHPIILPPQPQLTGALGAAVVARDQARAAGGDSPTHKSSQERT
jgi:(R)-2-hydroxyacyl-CoA dehydratese activating ATPase